MFKNRSNRMAAPKHLSRGFECLECQFIFGEFAIMKS